MSDISDVCLELIEEHLDQKFEPRHGYVSGSTAVLANADLYQTLCKKLRTSVLFVDAEEQRMRFTTYIDSSTGKAFLSYRTDSINISIEMHDRNEILAFLNEHGPKYKIGGESDYARSAQRHAYDRARNGVGWTLMGALAISAGFMFDVGYVDESLMGFGTILILTSLKDVKRYFSYRGRRG